VPPTLAHLEAVRRRLYAELAQTGDLRRGSLAVAFRRCGKDRCVCRQPQHPGHGPQHLLTMRVAGRGRSRSLRPGPELRRLRAQLANHRRFRSLVQALVTVNEHICRVREADSSTPLTQRRT
jgi:hypothetical protein